MQRHSTLTSILLLLSLLSWILAGCSAFWLVNLPQAASTPLPPTVTPNPFPSPTSTPFQPVYDSPPVTESPSLTSTLPPTSPQPPVPTNTLLPPPVTNTSGISQPRPQYTLAVVLDYLNHSLSVSETIVYPNLSPDNLTSLVLAVEPNRWEGAFQLDWLTVDNQLSTNHLLEGQRFEVYLPQPLLPGSAVALAMHFEVYLPWLESNSIFGYNNAQSNLVDWYPFIAPYVPGQGWLLHEPRPVGEHLVYDIADFDVTIELTDPSLSVVIAASSPAVASGAGWHYLLPKARTFAFTASDRYLSTTTSFGSVIITSYFFSGHDWAGQAVLDAVSAALSVYANHYSPYPYTSLSIVEAYFPDGMEYGSLFFLNRNFYLGYDGTAQNNLTMIGIHEAAHAWWFGLVGNDQALEPWLDEALAIYGERLFYNELYPNLVSWWWSFRIYDFLPTGWVDSTIYDLGSFRPYTNAVYLRGAEFLEDLRVRVGSEAFYAFLQDYSSQMAYKRATADDFFRILRLHTSVDFSDIVSSYFQYSH